MSRAAMGEIKATLCWGATLLGVALLGPVRAAGADLRDLCLDRPGKATSPCTVDAGHLQLEADLFNGTFQTARGEKTRSVLVASPTLKLGLSEHLDVEASWAPVVRITTRDALGKSTTTGSGDLFVRAKYAGMPGHALTWAVEPFVKIPTASKKIGNGATEAGLLIPLALDVRGGFALSATPEVDVIENADGTSKHISVVNVVGLSKSVGGGVTLGTEMWAQMDVDPAGTKRQYSLDLDAAWQPAGHANLQFDVGVNFGLNAETPDLQVYAGLAHRF